jgi:hypothetical protein
MRVLGVIVLLIFGVCHAQNIIIRGRSPQKVGTRVVLERFEDFITRNTAIVASTELQADSSFSLSVSISEIEKVKLSVGNNYAFMLLQPGTTYTVIVTNQKISNFNNPIGNEVEMTFLGLDENDINYKTLTFDRWIDAFIGENYHLRSKRDSSFLKNLVVFEQNVANRYKADTTEFLRNYIKYRVASLEDLNFVGARDERARYTVNIAPFTVYYKNEEYMKYIRNFYKNYFERTAPELNNKIYKAIVAGSPTRLINDLSADYRLANVRLRELVMIISLSDVFHDKAYPQSRIAVILDSVANNGLFMENRIIARNVLQKVTQLTPGAPTPKYEFLNRKNELISNGKFAPRYTYIQFIDINQTSNLLQFEMLKTLYAKYNTSVEIITVVVNEKDWDKIEQKLKLQDVPWTVVVPKDMDKVRKSFQLSIYPHYILIDAQGYVVQSPAATPVPDGTYKTIDYYFFEIHKAMSRGRQ